MAFSTTLPVSEILRSKHSADVSDDEPKTKSREDWRKAKELEEARKVSEDKINSMLLPNLRTITSTITANMLKRMQTCQA